MEQMATHNAAQQVTLKGFNAADSGKLHWFTRNSAICVPTTPYGYNNGHHHHHHHGAAMIQKTVRIFIAPLDVIA
jgi:hypothetical protein